MMQTGIIQFHGNELLSVREPNGKIYIAMKPIVEGMGLEWSRQSKKIKEDGRFNCVHKYMVGIDGKNREMLSMEFGSLPAFLYSINPNKVREDLKEKILAFQQETFNVINNYWNNKFTVKTEPSQELLMENYQMAKEIIALKNREIEAFSKQQALGTLPNGVTIPRRGMYLDESEKREIAKLWKEGHSIAEMMRITGRSSQSITKYKNHKKKGKK